MLNALVISQNLVIMVILGYQLLLHVKCVPVEQPWLCFECRMNQLIAAEDTPWH